MGKVQVRALLPAVCEHRIIRRRGIPKGRGSTGMSMFCEELLREKGEDNE